MRDTVFIRELKIDAIIGIYPHERNTRQPLLIDLDMASDIRRAAATEDINDALDYEAISNRLYEFVSSSEFQLIETLAQQIADLVLREFNVTWLRLTLHKPEAVARASDVGVVIERSADNPG